MPSEKNIVNSPNKIKKLLQDKTKVNPFKYLYTASSIAKYSLNIFNLRFKRNSSKFSRFHQIYTGKDYINFGFFLFNYSRVVSLIFLRISYA